MNPERVSVNALTDHCRPVSDASRPRPTSGSATLTTVVSSRTNPEPRAVATMAQRPDGWESRSVPAVVTLTNLPLLDVDQGDGTEIRRRAAISPERIRRTT